MLLRTWTECDLLTSAKAFYHCQEEIHHFPKGALYGPMGSIAYKEAMVVLTNNSPLTVQWELPLILTPNKGSGV